MQSDIPSVKPTRHISPARMPCLTSCRHSSPLPWPGLNNVGCSQNINLARWPFDAVFQTFLAPFLREMLHYLPVFLYTVTHYLSSEQSMILEDNIGPPKVGFHPRQ